MRGRLDAVDVARGLALVAMAGYHFTWDLAYFGVVDASTPFRPPMQVASHLIGGAFLGLAGLSLALAHARGFRPRNFLKRLALIGAAAAAVSAATYWQDPKTFIFFGILHCLFAASLVALPFMAEQKITADAESASNAGKLLIAALLPRRDLVGSVASGLFVVGVLRSAYLSLAHLLTRPSAALAFGLVLIVTPFIYASPIFNPPWLIWLGLGTEDPSTLDWRPLLPWAGVVLIGLGLTRLAPPIPTWRAKAAAGRALAFAGRHSLAIYLIHQPAMIGLLYAVLQLSGFSERLSVETYARACRPACVEAGGEIDACERACACVIRDASAAGLAGRLGAHSIGKEERSRIGAIVETCGSQAR